MAAGVDRSVTSPSSKSASDENEGRSGAVPPRRCRLCTAAEEDCAAAAMFDHGYLAAKAGIQRFLTFRITNRAAEHSQHPQPA